MRTKIIIALFAVLFVAGTVFAGGNANKVEKKAFSCVSAWYGAIDPGTTTISGKVIHIRGMKNSFQVGPCSDERFSGAMTTVFNGNFDQTGSGPIWGTFQIGDANAGWEGSWNGKMYNHAFGKLNWLVKYTGFGTGENEGLKIESYGAFDTLADFSLYPWTGYDVGEITNVNKD